ESCANMAALATIVNNFAGNCAQVIPTVSTASADFAASCEGAPDPMLENGAAIEAFLSGKTLVMTGDDIPEWPLGFFEGANFGAATQCYSSVTIAFDGTTFTTTSDLGTLVDAPNQGDVGTCDNATVSNQVAFPTTGYAIDGTGECFDVRFEYAGFTQTGRARVTAEAVEMELYFLDQATGATCADGAVGSAGVQVNGMDLGGNSVQVYRIAE
ncbi:MAG: hypothetical protein KC613_11130, partial [Myxococcales bacterium]|nr:hypothetical protein [Myxococcales bacterium]